MPNPTLLFVSPANQLNYDLVKFIERSGYVVIIATTGKDALNKLHHSEIDIVLSEIHLPDINGRELLRFLRSTNTFTPFILFSDIGDSIERATALNEGADDYLYKDIHSIEIVARIHNVLRRVHRWGEVDNRLIANELCLSRDTRKLYLNSCEVQITPKAYMVLEYLMLNHEKVVSRDTLLRAIWGWDYLGTERTIDIRVNELRRVLNCTPKQPRFIQTVLGYGYQFMVPVKCQPRTKFQA